MAAKLTTTVQVLVSTCVNPLDIFDENRLVKVQLFDSLTNFSCDLLNYSMTALKIDSTVKCKR